jgi:hypothetical protein
MHTAAMFGFGRRERHRYPVITRLIKSIQAEAARKTEWPIERRLPHDEWDELVKEARSLPWQPSLPEKICDIIEIPLAGVMIRRAV